MSGCVRSCFQEWDVDTCGFMSKDDLAEVLRRLDPQTANAEMNVDALFSAAQAKPGEKISYETFLTWLFCDDASAQSTCLWEAEFTNAAADASKKHSAAKVDAFFLDVRKRITGREFAENVRGKFLARFSQNLSALPVSANFDDVLALVESTLLCTTAARLSPDEIRVAFDAHDVAAGGRGLLDADEFINLARSLQVRVALATLMEAEVRVTQDLQQLQSQLVSRENGLWEGAIGAARAKALQRYNRAAVDSYFDEVNAKLCSAEYVEHVKGTFFSKVDTNKDGTVSFDEVLGLIKSTLQCAADLGGAQKPTPEAILEVFTAHDSLAEGYGFMGGEEFLNLMRYLQVQVAEAMLPMSKGIKAD